MTDRERWIVYPLLFLALGTSLRDKLTQTVQADVIDCKTIDADLIRCKQILVGEKLPVQVRVSYGTITTFDAEGNPVAQFGPRVQCDELRVNDAEGKTKIVLGSNDAGGLITVFDQPNKLTLALGHTDRISGLLASNAEGKLIQWVRPFVRPATTDEPPDEDKDKD